jgi:hypothetical protein
MSFKDDLIDIANTVNRRHEEKRREELFEVAQRNRRAAYKEYDRFLEEWKAEAKKEAEKGNSSCSFYLNLDLPQDLKNQIKAKLAEEGFVVVFNHFRYEHTPGYDDYRAEISWTK